MSMTLSIAGLRVKVEVEFGGEPTVDDTAERAYDQTRAHRAAEADRNRWLVDWNS